MAAQLDDVLRYGRILEAQQAVLRMEDVGLLDSFSQEADRLVGDITIRNQLLDAYRTANPGALEQPSLKQLHHQVEHELNRAGRNASALASQMEAQASRLADQVKEASRELGEVLQGYGRKGEVVPSPAHFDRTG